MQNPFRIHIRIDNVILIEKNKTCHWEESQLMYNSPKQTLEVIIMYCIVFIQDLSVADPGFNQKGAWNVINKGDIVRGTECRAGDGIGSVVSPLPRWKENGTQKNA